MPDPRTYSPSMGMVREMARARLGEACRERLERLRCRLRGLIDGHGRVTPLGRLVLERVARSGGFHG